MVWRGEQERGEGTVGANTEQMEVAWARMVDLKGRCGSLAEFSGEWVTAYGDKEEKKGVVKAQSQGVIIWAQNLAKSLCM